MRDPTISVIMGTYNPDFKKLEIAIESIKSQSFKDWEYIICDDGSSNNAYEWLMNNYGYDRRFHILKNDKNIKLAATLNKCIDHSRGKYIARMDDDDYSYPYRFEKEIDLLNKNKNVVFVSSSIDLYDGEKVVGKYSATLRPKKKNFLWGNPFAHPATIFRKECLLKVGKYRVSWITQRAQDYDLFMRLYAFGYRGENIGESLLQYLFNPLANYKKNIKYAFQEMIIRFIGYKNMSILFPVGWLYMFKPIIIKSIPNKILLKIKFRHISDLNKEGIL